MNGQIKTIQQAKVVTMEVPEHIPAQPIVSLEMICTIPDEVPKTTNERLYIEMFLVWATNVDRDMEAIIVRWDNVLLEYGINVGKLDHWDDPVKVDFSELTDEDQDLFDLIDEGGYTGFVEEVNSGSSDTYEGFKNHCVAFFECINNVQL